MSAPPISMRRADLQMSEAQARTLLASGYAGRLATVGADSWPYVVPLLYILVDDVIYVHTGRAQGHFRANLDANTRACFVVDEPGEVFGYGRFECDSSLSYVSVMVFGRLRVVEDEAGKIAFFDALMKKYGSAVSDRPKGFYPRLHDISVFALSIERLTGKQIALPPLSGRWPAHDRTKSPSAKAPRR